MYLKFYNPAIDYTTDQDLTLSQQTFYNFFIIDFPMGPDHFINWLYKNSFDHGTGGNITGIDRSFKNKNIIVLHSSIELGDEEYSFYLRDTEYEKLVLAWKQLLKDCPDEVEINEDEGIYTIIGKFKSGNIINYGEEIKLKRKLEY